MQYTNWLYGMARRRY